MFSFQNLWSLAVYQFALLINFYCDSSRRPCTTQQHFAVTRLIERLFEVRDRAVDQLAGTTPAQSCAATERWFKTRSFGKIQQRMT
jgi:hypothetical protein